MPQPLKSDKWLVYCLVKPLYIIFVANESPTLFFVRPGDDTIDSAACEENPWYKVFLVYDVTQNLIKCEPWWIMIWQWGHDKHTHHIQACLTPRACCDEVRWHASKNSAFFSSFAHCEPETLHQAGKSPSFTDSVMNVIDVHPKTLRPYRHKNCWR